MHKKHAYGDDYRTNLINYWRQFYPTWDIPVGYHVHHIKPKCTFEDPNDPLIHHPKNLIALHPDDHISIHKCRGDKAIAGMLISIKGRIVSESTRVKLSKKSRGRKHTKESKVKIGMAHKGKKRTTEEIQKQIKKISGKNHYLYGKRMLEETKNKISVANTGKIRSREYKKLRSKLSTGENNGMYGKQHSNIIKELLSECKCGKKNPQFKGWYITPFGKIVSSEHQEYMSPTTLINYCKNNNKIITKYMYKKSKYLSSLGIDVIGKSLKDVGFSFEKEK